MQRKRLQTATLQSYSWTNQHLYGSLRALSLSFCVKKKKKIYNETRFRANTCIFFSPVSLSPAYLRRSFRAEKPPRLWNMSAGIKNVASPRRHRELAVRRRRVAKVRRFRGHSFFSIKALSLSPAPSSLVPSLTDLHLFEPRPSKRRSDEKLDAGIRGDRSVNFTGTSDYSARWRENGRKRRSIIISSSLMR